jgi:hypothetical protein
VEKDEQEEGLLAKLPYVAQAAFNSYDQQLHSLCLPDTRTIARRCLEEGRLGASFFFSRGGGVELKSARHFVTSIAVQLARRSPALRAGVCDAIRAHPDIACQTLGDQWKQLVLGPCSALPPPAAHAPQSPLVIVADALDECMDENGIASVLHLVSETLGMTATGLLMFLTSRPEVPIREGLESMLPSQRRHLILHRIDPPIVDEDIRRFINHHLGSLIRKRPMSDESAADIVPELVRSAGGLFIWAATACRFVLGGRPKERARLEMLLRRKVPATPSHPQKKLDEIYHYVLTNSISPDLSHDETEDVCSSLRTVLGAIAVLVSSLSATALDLLLNLQAGEVQELMRDLNSFFDVPDDLRQPIRLQHASVADFLLDKQRCTDLRFWVDQPKAHRHIASQCLRLIEDNLRPNMCDLREPGSLVEDVSAALIDQRFPPHVGYACRYWIQHVYRSDSAMDQEQIARFLQLHFLCWLEALSLLRKLDEAVEIVSLLDQIYVSMLCCVGIVKG